MRLTDAHLHLTEGPVPNYCDFDDLKMILANTAKPDEWDVMKAVDDPRAMKFYGVHPWYHDQWNQDVMRKLVSILFEDYNAQIGEIGLDAKRGNVRDQLTTFEVQVDLASMYRKIISVHCVGAEAEVAGVLLQFGSGIPGIIMHSYGSETYTERLCDFGCHFSISPRILSRSDIRIKRFFERIPDEKLLFETDSPHAGKDFIGMQDFLERLSKILGRPAEELAELSATNLSELTGWEI